MSTAFPELTSDGLVLWRLRGAGASELWCYVTEFCGEMALSLHNLETGEVPIAESHWSVCEAVARAQELRDYFMSGGWQELHLDVEDQLVSEDSTEE